VPNKQKNEFSLLCYLSALKRKYLMVRPALAVSKKAWWMRDFALEFYFKNHCS